MSGQPVGEAVAPHCLWRMPDQARADSFLPSWSTCFWCAFTVAPTSSVQLHCIILRLSLFV